MKALLEKHCIKIFIAAVLAITVGTWYGDLYQDKKSPTGIEAKFYAKDQAKVALEHMQHWATWLAALQSGALAAFGSVLLHRKKSDGPWSGRPRIFAAGTIIFLGASILAATYVLGCLPSVALRLRESIHTANDIYEVSIFDFIESWKFRVGMLTSLEHIFALIGMVFLGNFVYSVFLTGRK